MIKTILRNEGVKNATLSFVFVTRQKMQSLNKKFLSRSYATDVLAFDLRDEVKRNKNILGDIIISTDAAIKASKIYGTSLSEELALYVVHGILHLLGYDDHSEKDRKRMRTKEDQSLKKLGKKISGIVA